MSSISNDRVLQEFLTRIQRADAEIAVREAREFVEEAERYLKTYL